MEGTRCGRDQGATVEKEVTIAEVAKTVGKNPTFVAAAR